MVCEIRCFHNLWALWNGIIISYFFVKKLLCFVKVLNDYGYITTFNSQHRLSQISLRRDIFLYCTLEINWFQSFQWQIRHPNLRHRWLCLRLYLWRKRITYQPNKLTDRPNYYVYANHSTTSISQNKLTDTWCQFHKHFMCIFFIWNCNEQISVFSICVCIFLAKENCHRSYL